MDARHVCEHTRDCSIWSVSSKSEERCKICDCGALRGAIYEAEGRDEGNGLWEAWRNHLEAIEKSMEIK